MTLQKKYRGEGEGEGELANTNKSYAKDFIDCSRYNFPNGGFTRPHPPPNDVIYEEGTFESTEDEDVG